MALIKCKECGNDMSDSAKSCPKCGAKNKIQSRKDNIIIAILVPTFIILFFVASYFLIKL